MWLRAEIRVWTIQNQHSLTDGNLENLCYPAQIFLAPRPPASERRGPIDPRYSLDTPRFGTRQKSEARRVVVVEIGHRPEALSESSRRVHANAQDRAGNIDAG